MIAESRKVHLKISNSKAYQQKQLALKERRDVTQMRFRISILRTLERKICTKDLRLSKSFFHSNSCSTFYWSMKITAKEM